MSNNVSSPVVDLSASMLKSGHGLALSVTPSSGILGPFEILEVQVTVFSDMWGEYKDTLLCKVSDICIF